MRGSDRHGELFVSTDLLSVWTDPDTAMEAVGASLGIFGERVSEVRRVLSSDTPLRSALYATLLSLVEGGALEKRACSDGRYAFRWRDDIASAVESPDADRSRLVGCLASLQREPAPAIEVVIEPETETQLDSELTAELTAEPAAVRHWSRFVVPTVPLLLPAVSCVLALLAFVWLSRAVAFVVAAALVLVGVVGLIRRVPFAGLWTVGVIIASLLFRLS